MIQRAGDFLLSFSSASDFGIDFLLLPQYPRSAVARFECLQESYLADDSSAP
jgi:hypothetical protein